MSETTDTPVRPPGRLAQAFGVVGGMGAWGVALLVAYPTVRIACLLEQPLLVHVVRWVATVVAVAATFAAWHVYRRAGHLDAEQVGEKRVTTLRFVGFGGMLVSAAGVLLLVVEDMATWVIDPCS